MNKKIPILFVIPDLKNGAIDNQFVKRNSGIGNWRMGLRIFLISLLFALISSPLAADEGDTLIIQTIDWDTPVLPGWLSPRSGTYQFPGDTLTFSRILMYYTLKCDPNQNPACGEWDYITYTRIMEHTGEYDSNLYYQPNYLVNNASPDSFMFMNDESFRYEPWLEYSNQTDPTGEAEIGDGGVTLDFHFPGAAPDGKLQHIYKASELTSAGLQGGQITGMKYSNVTGNINFRHFRIRMRHAGSDTLPPHKFINDGFTTVFDKHINLGSGVEEIDFSFPFDWDGTSSILVELSWTEQSGLGEIEADKVETYNGKSSVSHDYYLDFGGWDYIDVPASVFETVDSAITITFWHYGDPAVQPANASIFEGVDSAGHRVLNAHIPWSNGRIYWDAGWEDGYDRLDLTAGDPSDYKGKWNHWAFTKDLNTSIMMVYLNGELFNIGGGKNRPMNGITAFRIGAAITYDGFYDGMIDNFRIWDVALDQEAIQNYMYRDVNTGHPNYGNLRVDYRLNEGSGQQVGDSSPLELDGTCFGLPGWGNYRGVGRFRNATDFDIRPHVIFENGIYDPALLDSVVLVDTFSKAPVNIVLFDPDDPPNPLDTLTSWPAYYADYIYDEGGNAVDSTLVAPDSTLYHEELPYYGDPFEIIIPWEIARYITPYGIGLDLGEGWTWVFDVTDYAPLLRDSVHITAGNFQELLDLKFYMIEGTPPRDVVNIEKVYSGNFNLSEFTEKVPPTTVQLTDAETYKLKTRTSGHGWDNPTNCAEFCYKEHSVDVNGETIYNWEIMQECSDNPLYPQGGTWIYDRAGWCPGAKVMEHDIEITPYIDGESVEIDYNSQTDPYGNYVLEVQLFSYGEPNFGTDAAVDEVIAPNNMEVYGRFNPTCSSPIIVIQNRGGDTLYTVDITYGPAGSTKSYSWTGALGFMQKQQIVLESFTYEQWVEGDGVFQVSLSDPNNTEDENTFNDSFETSYDLPPVYPGTLIIHFKTNQRAFQNHIEIFDTEGNLVFERGDFENNTLYVDTLTFVNGAFDFYLHDSGDNGISFWANNEGSGYLKFYSGDGDLLKFFEGDFGDEIYHSFYMDMYLGGEDLSADHIAFEILPNPSDGHFSISYAMQEKSDVKFSIYSSSGQKVWEMRKDAMFNGKFNINLENAMPGIYLCVMETGSFTLSKKLVLRK